VWEDKEGQRGDRGEDPEYGRHIEERHLDRRDIDVENKEGEVKGKRGVEETIGRVTLIEPKGMRW
jgi:hypothetical protein